MAIKEIKADKLKVYTPDIGDSEEIGLDQTTTSYSPRLNKLKEGETIQVKLNEKAIKWRISHDLYKDFKSGVRELFQNEARACRQARDKYNAKPKIKVNINPDSNSLTIQGIDSLGISEAVFDNVLRVLGVSGNTDGGNEVGQFGMGFASYTTLSDVVTVETWFRENRIDGSEQKYAFLGDNGIDFKVLPEPELDTFGTKLSLTYNESCDTKGIVDMIEECAKFCGIKVELIIENGWHSYHKFGDKGIYELEIYGSLLEALETGINNRCSKDKMFNEDGTRNWNNNYRINYYKKVHIDNDDYEFVGIIAMTNSNSYDKRLLSTMSYHLLAGVPIEIKFDSRVSFTDYALNIKNERKFMPTADRDRLTKEAEQSIQEQYDEEISTYFEDIHLDSINEYINSLNKSVFENISNFEYVIDADKYERINEVLRALEKYFPTVNGRHKQLKSMLNENKPLVCMKSLNSDYMARISTKLDDAIFFRLKKDEHDYEEKTLLLKQAGVIMGEQYIKDNKIRPLTKKEKNGNAKVIHAEKPIRIYNGGYRTHHGDDKLFGQSKYYGKSYISTTIGKVNEEAHDKMLIVDEKPIFNDLKDLLWETESPYVLLRDIKGLDKDEINVYSEWRKDLEEEEITYLTGKKQPLSKIKGEVKYILAEKEATVGMVKGKKLDDKWKNVILLADHEELFKIKAYLLGKKDAEIRYDYYINTETLIEETCKFDTDFNFYCNTKQKQLIYSKLPIYKEKCNDAMFTLILRAVSDTPYDFEEILELADKAMEE